MVTDAVIEAVTDIQIVLDTYGQTQSQLQMKTVTDKYRHKYRQCHVHSVCDILNLPQSPASGA